MGKVCKECLIEKPLDAYSWKLKGTPKAYQEVRCKSCRSKQNALYNKIKRESKEELVTYDQTVCPCDHCVSQTSCKIECLSFRTWEKHGV